MLVHRIHRILANRLPGLGVVMPPPLPQLALLPKDVVSTGVSDVQRSGESSRPRSPFWQRKRAVRPRERVDRIHLIREAPQSSPHRRRKSSATTRLVAKRASRPAILQQGGREACGKRQK